MKSIYTFICLLIAQALCAQEFSFEVFGVKEGLAQSQVNALCQDHRGYLWVGTEGGGLCRFDGERFKTYTTRDGLPDNLITSIARSSDRSIWIGTASGLCRFDGGRFLSIEPFAGQAINHLLFDASNNLWVGTENGLFVLASTNPSQVLSPQESQNEAIFGLCTSATGGVWAANAAGIWKITLQGTEVKMALIVPGSKVVSSIYEDQSGKLWVAYYGQGISRLSGEELITSGSFSDRLSVLCMSEHDGLLWMGTLSNGLLRWDEQELLAIDDNKGLPNNQVRSLLSDNWNNLWVGTSGGGLARYFGQQILYLNQDSGLPGRQVYSIQEGHDSLLWLGVADKGLVRYNRGTGEIIADSLITQTKVKCQFKDSKGRIWCGTEGQGIRIYSMDSTWTLSGQDGLGGAWIRAIDQDREGHYWIATAGGGITKLVESVLHEGKFESTIFNRYNDLREDRVNVLKADSLGRIWYGTESGGLGVILEDESVLSFVPEIALSGRNIRSLEIDEEAWLWIGSGDKGLSVIDLRAEKLTINPLPTELQPGSGNAYLIKKDPYDRIWVGTNNGVYRYSRDESRSLKVIHIGREEGFQGMESCTNAGFIDSNGLLWIGTVDGVNCILPKHEPGKSSAPLVSLSEMSLFYKALSGSELSYFLGDWNFPKDTLVFTYDQNHLGFDLEGIRLSDPGNLLYQWWMIGYDSTWTPLLNSSSATFSNLPPGEYTFRYRACSSRGDCSEGEPIYLKILSPFWQEAWFKIVSAIGLSLVLLSLFGWRLQAIKKKSRERTNRLKLQNKVLELEQQALRLQMNPHFIFNTLNSIQGLIALKDSKEARRQLSDFSKLMRSTLENSREELIPLSEELEATKTYAELERTARSLPLKLEIIDESNGERWVPPLILQPFVENAIVHGLSHKPADGVIEIRCREENGFLLISITDNGKGREKTNQNQGTHRSLGVSVTRERIEKGSYAGKLEIEDLFDLAGDPRGTAIHIKFPIEEMSNLSDHPSKFKRL